MPILLTTAGDILLQMLWGQCLAFLSKLNLKHSSSEFSHIFSLSTSMLYVTSQGGGMKIFKNKTINL